MTKFIPITQHALELSAIQGQLEWYRKEYNSLRGRMKVYNILITVNNFDSCKVSKEEITRYKRNAAIQSIAEKLYDDLKQTEFLVSSDGFNDYYKLELTTVSPRNAFEKGNG